MNSPGEKCLEWPDSWADKKATITQISNRYKQGMQRSISGMQYIQPWTSVIAEYHTEWFFQLRTGNWDYISHVLTNTGQEEDEG